MMLQTCKLECFTPWPNQIFESMTVPDAYPLGGAPLRFPTRIGSFFLILYLGYLSRYGQTLLFWKIRDE
jgi:hypothetical protein